MHQVTRSMKLKEFPDEVWDRFWDDTYNRLERNVGWILFSIGGIVLLAFGIYEVLLHLFDDSVGPWWVRAATGVGLFGRRHALRFGASRADLREEQRSLSGGQALIICTTDEIPGREIIEVFGVGSRQHHSRSSCRPRPSGQDARGRRRRSLRVHQADG